MNATFWQGKRVLVTGHTGFKGAWLSLWLERLGAAVTGYALAPPTEPSLYEAAGLEDSTRSIEGDVRDGRKLSDEVAAARPQIVFHLAAQSLVHHGYRHPVETYETNVIGTANLLAAARNLRELEALVCVTSDKCYRNNEWPWGYRENDPLGGKDPYSSSKAAQELVTEAFRSSYFQGSGAGAVGVATARSGNVVGGGDWAADRLVPDLVRGFERRQAVPIRRPDAIRPWQHVLEPLRGYLELAEALARDPGRFSAAWNFGPLDADAQPVRHVADRLATLWGDGARWQLDGETRPAEATFLKLDCSQARVLLGWTPVLGLEQALAWTVDWHRRASAGESARELCREQIERYEARCRDVA